MQARLVDVPGAERQALAPEAAWHTLSAEEVLRAEEADPRHGLSSAEAASRAGRFGPNTLAAGRAEPRWRAFIRQYSDLRYYTFPGGCATYRFVLAPGASPVVTTTVDTAVAFMPRSALVSYIRRTEGLALCGRGAACPG